MILRKDIKKVILVGNKEKIGIVYDELKQFNIHPYIMCMESLGQMNFKHGSGKNYIVVCHNKYGEYIDCVKTIVSIDKKLVKNCYSQFQFYKILLENIENKNELLGALDAPTDTKESTCISLQFGLVMGGIEKFAANLYQYLNKYIPQNYIIDIKYQIQGFEYVGNRFYQIPENSILSLQAKEGFFKNVVEIVQFIMQKRPKYIFENGSMETLAALTVLKGVYDVHVVHIVHSDSEFMYQQCIWYQDFIQSFWCVSQEIYEKLCVKIPKRKQDCHVYIQYPNPVKKYNNKKVINKVEIAYAARLDKRVKRSDWTIKLLELLEKTNINYRLHIAGTGECLEEIQKFVIKNKLGTKVKVCGLLTYQEMKKFWEDKHIFLNFSIKEGTSLSLLEAMSNGVVPIVTNTSGVHSLVQNSKSGFVENNIEDMVNDIKILVEDADLYERISEQVRHIVKSKYEKHNILNQLIEQGKYYEKV